MKKLALIALTALSIGIAACSKDEPTPSPTPNPKTELELVVADSANKALQSAKVELYKTQADFEARNAAAMVQGLHYSGVDGRCKISSLEPITYWFYVESADGTMNNLGGVTSKTLVKYQLTTLKVTIK
jgi:hypothetical protein